MTSAVPGEEPGESLRGQDDREQPAGDKDNDQLLVHDGSLDPNFGEQVPECRECGNFQHEQGE